jgi:hypothetical protein
MRHSDGVKMDSILKAAMTAGVVLIVMWFVARAGQRLAEVVSALPTITAPTRGWLLHERGVNFAHCLRLPWGSPWRWSLLVSLRV